MSKEVKVIIPWYISEEEFTSNFRKMSMYQLEKYYGKSISTISLYSKKLKLNKFEIINSLTEDEVIFMYKALLNKEIKVFTNGVYNHDEYIIILIRYMINDILKWNKEDICNNYSTKTFKDNGLGGLLGIKKFSLYNYLIKSFPEYNIQPWELRSSTIGNGWTEENTNNALKWFKEKLLENKGIDNINCAGSFGFNNLLSEYYFLGLCNVKFNGSNIFLFEEMYGEIFSKEEMLQDNYSFDIKSDCVPKLLEGKVYKLTNEYNTLDNNGKTLINEIIRFCEINKKFPIDKELNNNDGYICRTQFFKYFKENSLKQMYNYITPVYDLSQETNVDKFRNIIDGQNYNIIFIKPNAIKCIKCGEIKEFIEDNFSKGIGSKFGLKYICKDCETKESYERNLLKSCKKNNILITDRYNIYSWYDAFLNNNLKQMPEFCYQDKNIIDIIRYIFNIKLNLHSIEEICSIGSQEFEKYRIDMSIFRLGGKLLAFQKCFPELNITENDVFPELYTDININEIISCWMNDNKLSANDLLKSGLGEKFSKKMDALWARKFSSIFDIVMWYYEYNNILHPIYFRPIDVWDFESVPHSFWQNKQNRLDKIKHYCEQECKESILNTINNTDNLKLWVYEYFRSELISKIFAYNSYNLSLYDLLVESYPIIKENNILFDWEWHQFNKSDKPILLRMLRELVEFRLDGYIKNPIDDIPSYINRPFIATCYPKFIKHINKKRFKNFYTWCCEAFPEYANYWIPEDFGLCVAYDRTICDSIEEKVLYEYLKRELGIQYIEAIGSKHSGKHSFILPYDHEDNKYCPDFVIEYINDKSGTKIRLQKPIYLEYYGLYSLTNPLQRIIDYRFKTDRKNEYYKSNNNIMFLDIYPCDLKNNFELLREKYKKLMAMILQVNKIVA